jgi:hypothetical protein
VSEGIPAKPLDADAFSCGFEMQLLDHSRVIAATSEGKRTQGPSFCPVSPATLRGWQQALHPKERTLDNPALRENEAQLQYQALFAACASSATDALPTAFFLPQALDRASPTASSTAFSVKPFFTAFLTAFSNFFAAFFFALSFAIFPHSYFCRRAAFSQSSLQLSCPASSWLPPFFQLTSYPPSWSRVVYFAKSTHHQYTLLESRPSRWNRHIAPNADHMECL